MRKEQIKEKVWDKLITMAVFYPNKDIDKAIDIAVEKTVEEIISEIKKEIKKNSNE